MYGRDNEGNFCIPADYVDAVRRAGAVACLVAPGDDDAQSQLKGIDGLILVGGGDLGTQYGGNSHSENYLVDDERDQSEFALVKYAFEKKLPVFAICRGMQVVNAVKGGALYGHLPDEVLNVINHRTTNIPPEPIKHEVVIETDSLLNNITLNEKITVLSWHHQAIKILGGSLTVSARATDGVIEAIEMPNYPWFLGVQWHPELNAKNRPYTAKVI
ncbi:gamma-glutamyl-gamma-aminobutyrate hydrolase family protein [Piscirickettsia litoralis]|uniref:gamma-glutamyl-gamma-aminobutyrate hydrolase family protein n=1 Tax=Piscirickettsia litoralis TaxID=1891921 RepID=UPI001300F133|nr:gamma-glutamyl-gamma-aminobutyrate hydrolase family protein [Piscirickettsia litoralis]